MHDIVEGRVDPEDGRLYIKRILTKSGNRTVRVMFEDEPNGIESPLALSYRATIEAARLFFQANE